MNYPKRRYSIAVIVTILLFSITENIFAQGGLSSGNVTGNVQLDFQYYLKDDSIGFIPSDTFGLNSWTEVVYTNKGFTAGLRYEAFQPAMVGYNQKLTGQGIPYKFISYHKDNLTVTAGSYYAQFGNGLLLRTYQDKGLGIDNAMNGLKVDYVIEDKIYLTALSGRPRYYYGLDTSTIRAADVEIYVSDFLKKGGDFFWKAGGSYVNREYPPGKNDTVYPEYVEAYSVRSLFRYKNISVDGEYAQKSTDPLMFINGRNDTIGTAYFVNASYSTKGFGFSAQYKGVSQFDFRSNPTALGLDKALNFLPPIGKFFSLKEFTRYPFVSTGTGEQGIQAEATWSPKRGKTIVVNYSKVHDAKWEDKFYESIYVEGDWKFSKKLTGLFAYQYIDYDFVLQSKTVGKLFAHIYMADITYRLAKKTSVRAEVQYLTTGEDKGDWIYGLMEFSFAPHFTIAVVDEVNLGYDPEIHYYAATASYTKGSHKFILSGGRQSEGFQCAGGVCRKIPAYTGIGLTLLSSF